VNYKIRIVFFNNNKFYWKEVKGEPFIIKGFEEAQLFLHKAINQQLQNCWRVSEVTTGFFLSESSVSPQQAKRNCTKGLKRKGIERFRKSVASITSQYEEAEEISGESKILET